MEVMEEGNLMDRIPILLQRDLQYYQEKQNVLQEKICPGVVGGKLDFPRYASFASIKIVLWWEDEYLAAYRKHSGLLHKNTEFEETKTEHQDMASDVKGSNPEMFVSLVTKSADKLLEHLHCLSQESLDHADLTVLTATIGAAALIKNCLWVYLQSVSTTICPPTVEDEKGGSLKLSYKQYSEMTEALAERLLDLHCRLLTLYIMQDAESLHWENQQTFFESERGSYTIQMWWLYIKGTREDLWNSVPPKMAQRVFAGMLNETLTVLTVRYTQTIPSFARSQLLLCDVTNILFCVSELLASISENGEAYIGLQLANQSKIIRDIHAKCQELFACLLLRGAPLGVLFKLFRKGTRSMDLFSSRQGLPSGWIVFTLPRLFPVHQAAAGQWVSRSLDLPTSTCIALELKVLLAAPQPNWSHLLKVLLMRDATITTIVIHHLMKNLPTSDNFHSALEQGFFNQNLDRKCEAFLCAGECFSSYDSNKEKDPIGEANYQVVLSLVYIIIGTGKTSDISASVIAALEKGSMNNWSDCLDKRQVWDQKRPPWLEAILHFVYPILDCVVQMLVNAVQTGATMYQAMSLAITCLSEMWDCIPDGLYKICMLLSEIVPVATKCLGDSVLIQILFAALYTKLLEMALNEEKNSNEVSESHNIESQNPSKASICHSLCEAICSLDEDNKHTEQLKLFLKQIKESKNVKFTVLNRANYNIGGGGGAGGGEEQTGLSGVSTVKIEDLNGIDDDDEDDNRNDNNIHDSLSSSCVDEFDVESTDYIAELLVSDIITLNTGKQCLKMCFNYLKSNKEWILQQLGVSSLETNEFQPLPGQKIQEDEQPLLKTMFYIGLTPFDQLLTGGLKIDYALWLSMPMSLTPERAWIQISHRSEFQENTKLPLHDAAMVAGITSNLKC
ncbi:uncharacterized protein LOC129606945 [Condylostylus longicornis]|uniref:uncharacterized protein LOC129606945 n=1 Tax=Condylostylus longicornis TaxID=2530218 RepID=UPI00244E4B5B|nr:uncharacterized protein LOC129606945 [Condylostylus longicornis]